MIFVSVGTHEQQFDRLISEVDRLKKDNIIHEDVIIQSGYSTFIPKYCEKREMVSYREMEMLSKESTIMITHGGPGTIMQAWKYGKKPIVVPRNPIYQEHVDEHQIMFARRLHRENKIICIEKIGELEEILKQIYIGDISLSYTEKINNTSSFIKKLDSLVKSIIKEV